VGAAIAAGSHLEKGICALLVQPATMIAITCIAIIGVCHICVIVQWPWFRVIAIAIRIITSPIRFIRAVTIPAPRDFGF
jgi:hypothetical protein